MRSLKWEDNWNWVAMSATDFNHKEFQSTTPFNMSHPSKAISTVHFPLLPYSLYIHLTSLLPFPPHSQLNHYLGIKHLQALLHFQSFARMRFSVLLLMLLTVFVVSRPRLSNCRVLPSPVKPELEFIDRVLVMKEKANFWDHIRIRSRVLIGNHFYTLSSGPSPKGPGHQELCFLLLSVFVSSFFGHWFGEYHTF